MSQIISGNAINLFIKKDNQWRTIAHSTTFSLELNTKYKQVSSKEDEEYNLRLDNIYWNLQGESLIADDELSLVEYFRERKKIRVCYGIVDEGATEPPEEGYIGECWITSLDIESNTGDFATYKYELEGTGVLRYGDISSIDELIDIDFADKLEPILEFKDPNATVTLNDDNDYDISDLNNPESLPVRFIVQRVVTF